MIQQYQLVEQIFAGNSEMAMLMRSHDWSLSTLGAVETWSQSLKTAIRIILGSRYPMFVWWGQQMTKFYNDAYIPILGKRHPQALGQPASRVWAEIWDTLGPQAEAVLNQGQSTWNQELLLVMERNGYTEETYFTFSYSPVANDDGPVGGIFCACSEDTQRVLSDRRLATLRELAAETVTAKTQEAACEISATVLTNNAYDIPFALFYLLDGESEIARLAGTTRLAAGTIASCEAIELTSAQKCQWQLKQVIETGESRIIENLEAQFGLLPGGAWSESPHQAVVLPLARSGETFGFLIAGVSPLRTFDDDYKGFFDLMAGQVTTAIANAQAYEAERKRAEALAELDRAKTAFFSNVSHEFRTPLTLMLSPLEEAIANLDGTIPPQEREQLLLVQRNGMRLLKLVNSLLDFSRIEAGRVQASYEPVDLATYTAELASTFRSLIERVGMSLIVDCPTLPEAIYVDREMWEKIVLNLLSNAFKFTLAGTITVRLQCVKNCVKLTVSDTGVGIPSEELPHLFERFHRIKNSQGRSFEGSGIGLSLVQELVKLHRGAIDVTSAFGQGSCFTVTIPTGTAHLPPERIGASRTLASTALGSMPYVEEAQRWLPENGDFRLEEWSMAPSTNELVNQPAQSKIQNLKSKILLADDNADMRDYIRRLLSGSYIVQTVADGVAALTAIENNPPNLVLTDVMMPGMDGFELLRSLRSNPATQDIPIILLSARAGEESRIEGLEAGADDYLIKPFSARELLARVEASLKLARLRQEATVRERTILGRVTDAFMAMDLDFRLTYANEAAQRVSRTPLEAMVGKTMWEAFPGTIGNQFEFHYRRSLSEQIAVDFEEYYAPFDLWVEVHVYPSPTGLSLFFRDINDRKKIEQERERFLAVGSDLQVITGINGYFHWVSPTFERTLGWTPDEMTSRPWTEFVHPDYLRASIAEADSLFAGNETFSFENRYRHKDGSYSWFLWNAQPYPEEQVIYGAAVDITDRVRVENDRKQTEEALRESEELKQRILESSKDCIKVLTLDSEIVYISTGGLCLLETDDPTLILNTRWLDIWQGEHYENASRAIAAAKAGNTGQFQGYLPTRKGTPKWWDSMITPVRNTSGQVTQLVAISRDITKQKQAETERERLLAQEQTAREAAETANRIKDEFLAVLSHELRSPLNPILGWSKLLQQSKLGAAKTASALASIERNARLQSQLIDDLLDISRILSGKLSLNRMSVDLNMVSSGALETVRLAAEAKSLQIQTTFSPSQGMVIGDSGRLQQVIWNLLSNAVKFTPQGGQITVRLTQTKTYAQILVTDTGKGINPEFLPYVFEHFRQEDGATTRKFGGLGLGLAIARQIVELHGGKIWVESRGEGQGATFSVELPLLHTANLLEEVADTTEAQWDDLHLASVRVLVVDDEPDSREFVAFVAEQAGAKVTAVGSAIEALQLLSTTPFDILLCDIGMPDMDGYMLVRQVRALPPEQGGQIPAIALTAYAGDFNQKQALAAGFQRHVTKPVEPNELVKAIVTLL
ncbi:ATP-binding protein [Microcoleus sp. AT3-D2]|uniref:ATP-binding protein n=1 Tax=Microcoleus sp. AT3-D2 TaxID=2818612 RepID=UPI002FD57A8C